MSKTDIALEFAGAELGDARRTRRAMLIAERWSAAPALSFPKMAADDAELQGLYGFHDNEDVDPAAVLEPHRIQTRERIIASGESLVLVLHDTTSFSFGGAVHREDMGWLAKNQQGFFAHFALAISADSSRRPLGVVGLSTHMRPRLKPEKNATTHVRAPATDPKRESLRWPQLVRATEDFLRGAAARVHVCDREADTYEMLSEYEAQSARHVTRVRETKRPAIVLDDERLATKVRGAAERSVAVIGRSAALSRRTKSTLPNVNKLHPPRDGRIARLEFAASRVRIAKPKQHPNNELLPHIDVNLVHVREVDAPDNAEAVEWLLYTTEPIETAEDVLRVVDYYRARWMIEELFKAIKSGCEYEKKQLGSTHGLLVALSICVPVAWQMLLLRHQSRAAPDAAAETVLSPDRLSALRMIAREEISDRPTAHEVYRAIAMIGGYNKWKKTPPGWQALSDGLEKLLFAEEVLAVAARKAAQKCD